MTTKKGKYCALLTTGLLGIIIYPTVLFGYKLPDFGFIVWIYLVPLFVVLQRLKGFRVFGTSFLASFLFYLGSLYWLIPAMKNFGDLNLWESMGVLILLVLIFSFYFSVALSLSCWVSNRTGIPRFITHTLFLLTFDYFRSYSPFNGFPWPMPAYSQGAYLAYFQWIDVCGVHGLNLLIYLVNGLLADVVLVFLEKKERDKLVNRVILLFLLLVLSFFGSLMRQDIIDQKFKLHHGVMVSLAQGNIPQDLKWDPKRARFNLEIYDQLTRQAHHEGAELLLWPETAYPYTIELSYMGQDPVIPRETIPIPVIFGSVSQRQEDYSEEPIVYNSAFLMGTDARPTQVYHKRHLVPFGEYVPMKNLLTFAKRLTVAVGDFSSGVEPTLLEYDSLKIGSLICYEDIFPDLAREIVLAGANVLINITNDAWYGNTSAQYQHLVFSQFRALENRRYLVRATNTGISAFIDSRGYIIQSLKPFTQEVLTKIVYPVTPISFYSKWGDFVAWFCVIMAGLGFVYSAVRKGIRASPKGAPLG